MSKLRHSSIFRYCFAIAVVVVSVLIVWAIRPFIPLSATPVILAAIVASAWYAGMGPGLLSATLMSLLINRFATPNHSFLAIHLNDGDIPRILVVFLIAFLAAWLRRANDIRKARARQQAVIARLGQRALEGAELSELMDETVRSVAETLDITHSAILELLPDENALVVRAGTGWKAGIVGEDKVPCGNESLSGYSLSLKEPLIVNDLRSETRFRVQPALIDHKIVSSLAVIIHGPRHPFGNLVAHATRKTKFTQDDINFAQAIANVLGAAIERKRAEEHLENQQRWLESVLNLMPTPLLFIEPNTARVIFANKAADEMAGGEYPKGRTAEEYHTVYFCTDAKGHRIPDEQMPGVRAARGERLEGFQMDWHTPSGKRSIIVFSDTIPVMHGHPATVALVFQDITQLKQIEAELQQASQLKDEFLATVSHELRTPLNAILGWARMLRGGKLDDRSAARALETIERNAKLQSQIIEDLLDVSRIITGQLRLDVEAVELGPVVEAAVDAIRPAAEAKAIRLQVVLDSRAGPVLGDAARLQQVVWNLLSNATKFTPKGGRIQVSIERINSQVEIAVSDTGQGVGPDFLPHVFDRFRQEDSTLTRAHSGLGLGLAIVRHLVELHGGTVSAYSEGEGKGATFRVRFPLMIVHDSGRFPIYSEQVSPPTVVPQIAFEPSSSLRGIRMLVVDDDVDALELVASILQQSAAEITTVASASEALELFKSSKPDILVSDIEMPGEDGYSLIRKIREIETREGGWMPAIALTAHARVEDRLRALSAGYQSHVAKPVEPAELVATVASLVRRNGKA